MRNCIMIELAPSRPKVDAACRVLLRYGESMIEQAIIVPDTSALLRLYACSPDARNRIVAAYDEVRTRTWVAHRTRTEVMRRIQSVKTRNRVVIPHVENSIRNQIRSLYQ